MNAETITTTVPNTAGVIGAQIAPPAPSPEQMRSAILNAIDEGYNTIRSLREKTGFDEAALVRELEILNKLFIVTLPGPPVQSYWIKGKVPKHGVFIKDGKAFPHEAKPKADLRQIITARNAERLTEAAANPANPAYLPLADESHLPTPVIVKSGDDEYCAEMPLVLLIAHPDNPRGEVNEDEPGFDDLVNSIEAEGVQQPLVVTRIKNSRRFRTVIGHRRARGSERAGRATVPVVIRSFESPQKEYSVMLIENVQRKDLNAIQEARAYTKLYEDLGKDIHAAARSLGLKQGYIKDRMDLLRLDVGIQIMIERNELGTGAGDILATLDRDKQLKLLPRAQRLNLSDLRAVAAQLKNSGSMKIPAKRKKAIAAQRETRDDEKFTRSGALKMLESLGAGAWVSIDQLKQAFADACVDSCLESKNEQACHGCPVPRLIASLVRRQLKHQG